MAFEYFASRIIFSKKQLRIFFILFVSLSMVLLFFLFFKTFNKYYIDALKNVYPGVYIVTDKTMPEKISDDIEVFKEMFEINIDDLVVSFENNEDTTFTLGSLGVRTFSKQHPPKVLQSLENETNSSIDTLYLSTEVYEQIAQQKQFHQFLYLPSDKNGHLYKFKVKPFRVYDHSRWMLMETSAAQKIFYDNNFNKAVFYAHMDETSLIQKVSSYFHKKRVYTWDENIALLSRALKESMFYIFVVASFAIFILTIASILFFSKELADDLRHLTRYAFFYGISFSHIYLFYLAVTNFILDALLLGAYYTAYIFNTTITQNLLHVTSYDAMHFIIMLLLAIFLLTAIFLAYTLSILEKKGGINNGA